MLQKFHADQAMRRVQRSIEDVPLWPPGKIVYLANAGTKPKKGAGGILGSIANIGAGTTVSYRPLWGDRSDFREVELTKHFLDDHDPENVLRALGELAGEWGMSSPYVPPTEVSPALVASPSPSHFTANSPPLQSKRHTFSTARFSLNHFNCLPIGTDVKENSGSGRRRCRKRHFRLLLGTFLCWICIHCFMMTATNHNVEDGHNTILRPDSHWYHMQAVLKAEYDLVDVRVSANVTFPDSTNESTFSGVLVTFCPLNWTIQKQAPSLNPMFSNLVSKSKACDFPFTMELSDVLHQMEASKDSESHVHEMALRGLIFHQSRCGSTWVANMLTRMHPKEYRVYSEPTAPAQIVKALEQGLITQAQASVLLRHVLTLMTRTNDAREKRTFIKLQSTMSRHLSLFRETFPTTPWMFLYRDSVQVMMSYLKDKNYRHAFCQGGTVRGLPPINDPPEYIQQMVRRHAPPSYSLTYEGYCAANIATVTEPVVEQQDSMGFVINYQSLPNALLERFNRVWNLTIDQEAMERMQVVSAEYSKGRGQRKRQFKDDTDKKNSKAWPEVKDAAALFLKDSFLKLEARAERGL